MGGRWAIAVLFDTRELPARDRAEALSTALLETSGATQVQLRSTGASPRGRLTLTPVGETAVFSAECDGVRLVRDARTARTGFDDVVAIAVHGAGTGRHATPDGQRLVRSGELMIVDLTRPFDFAWDGHGSSTALQVPRHLLDLSVDDVQRAGSRLTQSHLHDLVRSHLRSLAQLSGQIELSPASPLVSSTTVQLVRALLTDVASGGEVAGDVIEATMVAQVREYVEVHLREPDLGPDRIATALAVSRRQLFRVCSAAGLSIEQHIITTRLQRTKQELALLGSSATVASVAMAWGFKDVDHFRRRFKAAFGVTPATWQRTNAAARPGS